MKHIYTSALLLLIFTYTAEAQLFDSTKFVVLYRINTGGYDTPSMDSSHVDWGVDDYDTPSSYSNYTVTGNKVYKLSDTASVTFSPSVPNTTPDSIYYTERSINGWTVTDMAWAFPVPVGKKVEVRLYMADIYFTSPGQRTFSIMIDSQLVVKNLDLVAQYGAKTGIMKAFTITSDGTVNIDFIQGNGQPTIGGIELFGYKDAATSIIAQKASPEIKVFPNPFTDMIQVDLPQASKDISILDIAGNPVSFSVNETFANRHFKISTGNLPSGVYFLKTGNSVIRILKQ